MNGKIKTIRPNLRLDIILSGLLLTAAALFFYFAHNASIHNLEVPVMDVKRTCLSQSCIQEFTVSIDDSCCLRFTAPAEPLLSIGDTVLLQNSKKILCRYSDCETYKYIGKLP